MLEPKIRKLLNTAERVLYATMDLARVPEGSHLADQVGQACNSLHESLDRIVEESAYPVSRVRGPLVIPVVGRDPRSWRTVCGKRAGDWLRRYACWKGDGNLIGLCDNPGGLVAPQNLENQRVLDRRGYLQAVKQSRPESEPVGCYGCG